MERPDDDVIERVLDDRASGKEARCVAQWFATIEGQRNLSERLSSDFARIECGELPQAEDIPSDEMFRRLSRHFALKRRRRILFRAAAILLPCALMLGIGYRVDRQIGGLFAPVEYAEIRVPRGERMQMMFQDGTRVYINSETSVRYPRKFGLTHRDVYLEGEAYFEVAHNVRRPFRVHLADAEVEVLGTSFNVEAYQDEPRIVVTLDQGSVRMSDGTRAYRLAPSDRLIYDRTAHDGRLTKAYNSEETSLWKKNILSFRNASLDEVMQDLGRWYDVDFTVDDAAVREYFYTFTSDNAPLDTILREMELIAPVSFVRRDGTIHISARKSK